MTAPVRIPTVESTDGDGLTTAGRKERRMAMTSTRDDRAGEHPRAATSAFRRAQDRVLARYGVDAESWFVDVPALGGRAHVLTVGDGPPVVMAIGGGMVAAMWAPLMARLEGFTLHAFDPPGHGSSDTTTYRTETMRQTAVGFLDDLFDALQVERAPVVAQSMGGLWTTWLALDRPTRVAAISYVACPATLLGTSAPVPLRLSTVRPLGRLFDRLQPPSTRQVERLGAMAGEPLADLPELRDLFLAHELLPGAAALLHDLHRALVRVRGARPEVALGADELDRVTQPVQLVWGDHDPFGPPSTARRAAAIVPDAELHLVHGGHAPWFTGADVIGPLVSRFLRRHTGPTGPPVTAPRPSRPDDRPERPTTGRASAAPDDRPPRGAP